MMMVLIMMFSMATMNAFGMVAMAEPVETTTSQVKDNPGTGDNSILPWAIGGGAIAVAAAVAAVFLGRKKIAGSARRQFALWFQSQLGCGHRGQWF